MIFARALMDVRCKGVGVIYDGVQNKFCSIECAFL